MIKDFMANAVPIGAQKNATIETKFTQKKCKKVKKKMIHCSLMVLFKTKNSYMLIPYLFDITHVL
jgi:hypothetical protein